MSDLGPCERHPLVRPRRPDRRPLIGRRLAYDVLWEAVHGPLNGRVLHHLCENPWCVNLAHLEAMTHQEHAARHGHTPPPGGDRYNAKKTHCPAGHPYDEANTRVHPVTGWRTCRACHRERRRRAR